MNISVSDIYSNGISYLVLDEDFFFYRDGTLFAGRKLYSNIGFNLMVNSPAFHATIKWYGL